MYKPDIIIHHKGCNTIPRIFEFPFPADKNYVVKLDTITFTMYEKLKTGVITSEKTKAFKNSDLFITG
jgi:hypothetical protein